MSEIDNEPEDAQGEQPDDATEASDGTQEPQGTQGAEGTQESDSGLGAGTTEGADSFGPTDVVTEFDSPGDGSDAGNPQEGESDSAFGGETGEFGSEQDTTDGNTSAGSDAHDTENG